MTPKQRMLNAYRGVPNDRPAVAPELWYYYPAKVLGVDMIDFWKTPFHRALKITFEKFGCEGWGCIGCGVPVADVESRNEETWLDRNRLRRQSTVRTPHGVLTSTSLSDRRDAAGWVTERPIKDPDRDLKAYEHASIGGDPAQMDVTGLVDAWNEVGQTYLLEVYLGDTFFDYYGGGRQGEVEATVVDLAERRKELEGLQQRYIDFLVRKARAICQNTPYESLFIGCTWSCLSLLSPAMWRTWDKPVIRAVCDEVHRHGRLLHVHFHGRCMAVVEDFAEIGIDCVCPFERPPGGDVAGAAGLKEVARRLGGRTTMNGNVHTVETLIRGTPDDVRREVREVLDAFAGNPRVIVGTGDQVGRETPEENLRAMIAEAGNAV